MLLLGSAAVKASPQGIQSQPSGQPAPDIVRMGTCGKGPALCCLRFEAAHHKDTYTELFEAWGCKIIAWNYSMSPMRPAIPCRVEQLTQITYTNNELSAERIKPFPDMMPADSLHSALTSPDMIHLAMKLMRCFWQDSAVAVNRAKQCTIHCSVHE